MARAARRWLSRAKASTSEREIPSIEAMASAHQSLVGLWVAGLQARIARSQAPRHLHAGGHLLLHRLVDVGHHLRAAGDD